MTAVFNTLFPIDSSESKPSYAIHTNDIYIKLSPTAIFLTKAVKQGHSFDQIAQIVSLKQKTAVSASEIEAAYHNIQRQIQETKQKRSDNLPGFWLRFTILSERTVNQITPYLTPLFTPKLLLTIMTFFIGLFFLFQSRSTLAPYTPDFFTFILVLGSLLFHELGHSAACFNFGARPKEVGFTTYLIFPTFYSDVSDAWRLNRYQRAIVAISGIYFQLILGGLFMLLYLLTDNPSYSNAFVFIWFAALFSLLPIFRLDGYWLMADLLGVTNLGTQPKRIAKHYFHRLRGKQPPSLPWPNFTIMMLLLYTILSFSLGTYYFWRGLTYRWGKVVAYPELLQQVFDKLVHSPTAITFQEMQMLAIETYILSGLMLALLFPIVYLIRQAVQTAKPQHQQAEHEQFA